MSNEFDWMVLESYSKFINDYSDYITKDMLDKVKVGDMSYQETYQILIGSLFGLDIDKRKDLFNIYIKNVIRELDINDYINNPYYKIIKFNDIKSNNWQLKYINYKPFEVFVYDDLKIINSHIIPSIGYFKEEFRYPAIFEQGRLWMSICPNEINTMKKSITNAFGNVLVYGLGLGYYPYMLQFNQNVKSITIVEKDKNAIKLFKNYIYPYFDKFVKVIEADAFEFQKSISCKDYDYIFCDLWHDPSDGVELYKKMKLLEKNNITYSYWIEETLKFYL